MTATSNRGSLDEQPSPDRIQPAPSPEDSATALQRRRAARPKRASIACVHCRRRKVRCDVSRCGPPCTNCRLDCIDCGLSDRRRKYFKDQSRPTGETHSGTHHPDGIAPSTPEVSKRQASAQEPALADAMHEENPSASSASRYTSSYPAHEELIDPSIADLLKYATPESNSTASNPSSFAKADATKTRPQLGPMPCFLTCDLSNVSSEDISYLRNKGCFDFPEKGILNELLLSYFDYIAPHMPFIDETGFWEMYHALYYDGNQSRSDELNTSGLTLLLFQAMLFAATTCAPMTVLSRLGYASRSTARRDAFFRVRALYSLNVERDSTALVQTFLLMSYWRGDIGEDKDVWHWTGLAVSTAIDIGLHRRSKVGLTQRQYTLRRRLWWSCVLRDRLVALSQQRQPRIRLEESDVSMLTLGEYNVTLRSGLGGLSAGEELGKRTAMSMFSLHLIRLVLCMEGKSPTFAGQSNGISPGIPAIWSRSRFVPDDHGNIIGHAELDNWRVNLPEVLQPSSCPDADESVLPCILVHRDALQIYYHKLILFIATRRLRSVQNLGHDSPRDAQLARSSSIALAELQSSLIDRDSLHCLPNVCFDTAAPTMINRNLQLRHIPSFSGDDWSPTQTENDMTCSDSPPLSGSLPDEQVNIERRGLHTDFFQVAERVESGKAPANPFPDLTWLIDIKESDDIKASGLMSSEGADSSSTAESSLHTSLLQFSNMLDPVDTALDKNDMVETASFQSLENIDTQDDLAMFL